MVGAECAPFSKTGGLGDVMASLPKVRRDARAPLPRAFPRARPLHRLESTRPPPVSPSSLSRPKRAIAPAQRSSPYRDDVSYTIDFSARAAREGSTSSPRRRPPSYGRSLHERAPFSRLTSRPRFSLLRAPHSFTLSPGARSPRPSRDGGGSHVLPLRGVRDAVRVHGSERLRRGHRGALLPRPPRRRRFGLRLPPVLLRGGREHLPGRDDGRDVARRAVVASRDRGGVPRPVRRLPLRRREPLLHRQRLARRLTPRLPPGVLPGAHEAGFRALHLSRA